MTAKRILFILPSLVTGGLERTQVTLANALSRSGYDVTVMTLDPGNELGDELDESVRLIHKDYKQHFGSRVPYIRHKLYDDGMWEKRATPRELYRYYVGDEQYDVEIAYFHGLPVKIIAGSTNRGARHLAWVHNDFKRINSYRFNFKDLDAMRSAYRSMDHIVCVSESARSGFIEAVGDFGNTVTIYNMLPVKTIRELSRQKIAYRYPKSGLDLVLVGRLKDSHKGQCRLIGAISRLKRDGYGVSLTLVGGGEDSALIQRTIEEHDAQDYVFMVGSQKNPYPYIAGADALVCASYYEGFNLTVAEALILEVPVVSTQCTGPCEILDNGKYGLLTDNSEQGLYNGLRELYRDPMLMNLYRTRARQRMEFFDEDRILKEITGLF